MLSNYKIRVNNEVESKEVHELFFELGGSTGSCDRFGIVCLSGGKVYTDRVEFFEEYDDCEAITLPQLRDMVAKTKSVEQYFINGVDAFNAKMSGETVLWKMEGGDWQEWTDITSWSKAALTDVKYSFKIKTKTVKIAIEIPTPFEPKDDDVCFVLDNESEDGFYKFTFCENSGFHANYIQLGVWRTEEEIKQVVEALRNGIKGVDNV